MGKELLADLKLAIFKNWLDTRPKIETHEPNVYPTTLGGVSRGFLSPFLDLGARSAIFWTLKHALLATLFHCWYLHTQAGAGRWEAKWQIKHTLVVSKTHCTAHCCHWCHFSHWSAEHSSVVKAQDTFFHSLVPLVVLVVQLDLLL